jgi:hypothetical protein
MFLGPFREPFLSVSMSQRNHPEKTHIIIVSLRPFHLDPPDARFQFPEGGIENPNLRHVRIVWIRLRKEWLDRYHPA